MSILETLRDDVIEGRMGPAKADVEKALAEGMTAGPILNEALIPAMAEVGRRFEREEYYVPEMLLSARAMKNAMTVLRPLLGAAGTEPIGTIAVGTVKGDLHDIGKNLVGMMLEGAGFQVVDLGVDVPPEKFVQAVKDGAQFIGLSALLTTTMPMMKTTIEELNAAGVRNQVKVLIGGAPITQEYADEIGADIFAPDASAAARYARQAVRK